MHASCHVYALIQVFLFCNIRDIVLMKNKKVRRATPNKEIKINESFIDACKNVEFQEKEEN